MADTGEYTYVVLNSSQLAGYGPSAWTNQLVSPLQFAAKRVQVALFDVTFSVKNSGNVGTYLVFTDAVVPNQIVAGEYTSLLRTIKFTKDTALTSSLRGTFEPNNLQWVDCAGTGTSFNSISVSITDSGGSWGPTTELTSNTLVTLVFRELE